MKRIYKSTINKYQLQRHHFGIGFAHLLDGLIPILSLGYYRGAFSVDYSTFILRRVMELRKQEQLKRQTIRGF